MPQLTNIRPELMNELKFDDRTHDTIDPQFGVICQSRAISLIPQDNFEAASSPSAGVKKNWKNGRLHLIVVIIHIMKCRKQKGAGLHNKT